METEKPGTELVQETPQADEQKPESEAGAPASLSVINPDDAIPEEPQPADSYDETDRKQDEAIDSLAEQTRYIAQQTEWMARQSYWTRLSAIFSLILGALTLIVLVYHGIIMSNQSQAMRDQSEIMKRQLESMHSGSAQTQEMIDVTRRMADSSQSMTEQNRELVAQGGKQADIMSKQADTMGRQFDAMREQARSMASQSEIMGKALGETKLTREVENRPYVAVKHVTSIDGGGFEIQFENTGRTPALNVHAEVHFSSQELNGGRVVKASDLGFHENPTIPAAYTYSKRVEFSWYAEFRRVFFLHVTGKVTYRDIFGRKHTTTFCFNRNFGGKFVFCHGGNDIN